MFKTACNALAGWPLYAVLAIASTWPLVRYLPDELVLGTEVARTVPQFNAWTIWWNVDRIGHGMQGYWNAPIFHPTVNTFALSEPQPATILLAPIYWLSGSVVVTTNLYLLISLVLNGWLAERLTLAIGLRRTVAIGTGAAMSLLPIVHWQIGVLQLVPIWALLWTLLAFAHAYLIPPDNSSRHTPWPPRYTSWIAGLHLGLAFSMAAWICIHHALFLALLLLFSFPFVARRVFSKAGLTTTLSASVCVGVCCGWLAVQLWNMPVERPKRPLELLNQLSLAPVDYLSVYGHSMLRLGSAWTRPGWFASPGWTKVAFALVGVVGGWLWYRPRAWIIWLAYLLALAVLLSLGTRLELWGWRPWLLIADYVPGFGQVRNVFRFAYFAQMLVVLLAACGVESVLLRVGSPNRGRWRSVAIMLIAMLAIFAAADPWPARLSRFQPGELARPAAWIQTLRERAGNREDAVLCLPMANGNDVRDFAISTDWMLAGTQHGLPLVNGYSGFFPPTYFAWREQLQWEKQLDATTITNLYHIGVRWLVVDQRAYSEPLKDVADIGRYRLSLQSATDEPIRVYHLTALD